MKDNLGIAISLILDLLKSGKTKASKTLLKGVEEGDQQTIKICIETLIDILKKAKKEMENRK